MLLSGGGWKRIGIGRSVSQRILLTIVDDNYMRLSDENAENGFTELINVEDPLVSWLLRTFHRFDRRELIGVALILSGIPFVVSGIIAFLGGFVLKFLTTVTVYIWTAGLLGGGLTFGWWAKRYPELWMTLRPVFDVPDDEYRAVVGGRITNMYNLKRALLWFPVPLVVGVIYDTVEGANFLIYVPEASPVPRLLLSAINSTFGIVSLLGLVIVIHVVFNHLRLVRDVMQLRLRDVQTAAADLTPLAWFNMVISAGWFITLTFAFLLLETTPDFLYQLNFSRVLFVEDPLISASYLFVVLVGFVLFAVPQYSIHVGLKSEKQVFMDEINTEYERLYEDLSSTDDATNSTDQVSVRLDVLEARRRNGKEIRTWAYDLPGVISLIATSMVPLISPLLNSALG